MNKWQNQAKPASNQLQLEGLGVKEEETDKEVRKWVMQHRFTEWAYFIEQAQEMTRTKGVASSKCITEQMRYKYGCKVSNDWTPYFARIALEQAKEQNLTIKFKINKSKADPYAKVVL